MSLNRYAPKRDANEPAIRKCFAHHGWHTEQRSSAGGWDLDAYPAQSAGARVFTLVHHVDVKMPDGKVTTAQEKKWAELHAKGIPVYVVRTEADVDALVSGEIEAWKPITTDNIRAPHPHANVRRTRNTCAIRCGQHGWFKRKAGWVCVDCKAPEYTPPLSKPVDAAKEAAETFAPGPPTCNGCGCQIRAMDSGLCNTCLEDARFMRSKKQKPFSPCTCTREQTCATCSVMP